MYLISKQLSILFLRFTVMRVFDLHYRNSSFNSLFEIPGEKGASEQSLVTFNSLFEILPDLDPGLTAIRGCLSILFLRFVWCPRWCYLDPLLHDFQFSFWDSSEADIAIPVDQQYRLSILFLRFRIGRVFPKAQVSKFFQFSFWDSPRTWEQSSYAPIALSILFLRFPMPM